MPDQNSSALRPIYTAPEPPPRSSKQHFTPVGCYLTEIALAIHFKQTGSGTGVARQAPVSEAHKAELRRLAVGIHHRALEHGYRQPCVALVEAVTDGASSGYSLEVLKDLAADQEWHRGEFLLFPVAPDQVEQTLQELLAPKPPAVKELKPEDVKDEDALWKELEKIDTTLVRELREKVTPRTSRTESGQEEKKPELLVPPIHRMTELTLENFRGFSKSRTLDTDADLVLVIGANGTGKSSTLEAASLAINGTMLSRKQEDLNHISHGPGGHPYCLEARIHPRKDPSTAEGTPTAAEETSGLRIQLTPPALADAALSTLKLDGKDTRLQSLHTGLGQEPPLLTQYAYNASITGWFPEELEKRLQNTVSGHTLFEVFYPSPESLRLLDERLGQEFIPMATQELNTAEDERKGREQTVRDADTEALGHWLTALNKQMSHPWLQPLAPKSKEGTAQQIFADWLESFAPHDTIETIHPENLSKKFLLKLTSLENEKKRVLNPRRAELEECIRMLEGLQRTNRTRYEQAEQTLRRFAAHGDTELPGLGQVLRALRLNRERWIEAASQPEFQGQMPTLKTELALVAPAALEKLEQELSAIEGEARSLDQQWKHWEQEINKCRLELSTLQDPEAGKTFLDDVKRLRGFFPALVYSGLSAPEAVPELLPLIELLPRLQADWEHQRPETQDRLEQNLRRAQDRLRQLEEIKTRRTGQNSPPALNVLKKELKQVANDLFRRFSFEGKGKPNESFSLKFDVENADTRRVTVKLSDERTLDHWSSGQKAQLAVILMVAQNLVCEAYKRLPHDLLFMDDVSTAYDLSNLTREALLWRQLAFGSGSRRQIFLTTHHEELTQHLFDLLVPPKGKTPEGKPFSVKVLRFKSWDIENGPDVETYSLEPDQVGPQDAASGLGRTLKEYLEWQS